MDMDMHNDVDAKFLIHGKPGLGPPKSTPKPHLDWFNRFCTAHGFNNTYFR